MGPQGRLRVRDLHAALREPLRGSGRRPLAAHCLVPSGKPQWFALSKCPGQRSPDRKSLPRARALVGGHLTEDFSERSHYSQYGSPSICFPWELVRNVLSSPTQTRKALICFSKTPRGSVSQSGLKISSLLAQAPLLPIIVTFLAVSKHTHPQCN